MPDARHDGPSIEIALAVYNGERYLAPFLDSLLHQSEGGFRLVVSDNKSTDRTAEILREYADRFSYGLSVLPRPTETVTAARNFARVAVATAAPYVMFADADDIWHADKVARTLAAMREAEGRADAHMPILVHSDLAVVDRHLAPIHRSFWAFQNVDPRRTALRQMLLRNCVTGCTAMANRALLARAQPIPEIAMMHDYWLALVAAALGRIVAIEAPLIDYRQHGANDTGAKRWGVGFMLDRLRNLAGQKGGRESIRRKVAQAAALRDRLARELPEKERARLEAFARLQEAGFIGRRLVLLRYGLWDAGLVRNLGLLAAV